MGHFEDLEAKLKVAQKSVISDISKLCRRSKTKSMRKLALMNESEVKNKPCVCDSDEECHCQSDNDFKN